MDQIVTRIRRCIDPGTNRVSSFFASGDNSRTRNERGRFGDEFARHADDNLVDNAGIEQRANRPLEHG